MNKPPNRPSLSKFLTSSRAWLLVVSLMLIFAGSIYFKHAPRDLGKPDLNASVQSTANKTFKAQVGQGNTRKVDTQRLATNFQSALTASQNSDRNLSENARSTKMVYTASRATDAIKNIESSLGLSDFQIQRLKFMVATTCAALESSHTNAILANPQSDKSREWAVASLLSYCEGWDVKANSPGKFFKPSESVLSVVRRSGKNAAIEYANESLSEKTTMLELFEAAGFLNEQGLIPTPEQLGLPKEEFGPTDQADALASAARLLECHFANACGFNSIATLTYCLQNGCTPNSDYLSALRQNVSPSEFQLIVAYTQWMLAQRNKGGG